VVVVTMTTITCTVPNTQSGPGAVVVEIDAQNTTSTDVLFTDFNDAGVFYFADSEFTTRENRIYNISTQIATTAGSNTAEITLRRNGTTHASPATVVVSALERSTIDRMYDLAVSNLFFASESPKHFTEAQFTLEFGANELEKRFNVTVNAGSADYLRAGSWADLMVTLRVDSVAPLHGTVQTTNLPKSKLRIQSICEMVVFRSCSLRAGLSSAFVRNDWYDVAA
jgi:hypothetical protein